MKYILKTFKVLLINLGILILLLVAGVFSILKWPHLILNETTFRYGAQYLSRFDILLDWQTAHIQVESKSLLHKNFLFSFEELCIQLPKDKAKGCFEKFLISAEVAWQDGVLRLIEAGPVEILSDEELVFTLAPNEEKSSSEKTPFLLPRNSPTWSYPELLEKTKFQSVQVSLKNLLIKTEGNSNASYRVSVEVSSQAEAEKLQKIDLTLNVLEAPQVQSAQLQATLHSASGLRKNDVQLEAQLNGALRSGERLHAKVQLKPTPQNNYYFNIQGEFKPAANLPITEATIALAGELRPGVLEVQRIQGQARSEKLLVKQATLGPGKLVLSQPNEGKPQTHLSFDAPLHLDLTRIKLPNPTWEEYVEVPTQIDLIVKSELESDFFPSMDRPVRGHLDLDLKTISQKLLTLAGNTSTKFAGVPKEYPQDWQLETEADLGLKIESFQRLKKILQRTAFAIPAPLNVLDGTIEAKVDGKVDIIQNKGTLPIEFNTRLTSKEEKFNTDGAGELRYQLTKSKASTSGSEFKMDLVLSDLQIALPTLDVGSGMREFPAFFADKRFVDSEQFGRRRVKKSTPNFRYQVTVKTPPQNPARLLFNFAQGPIPINLDLQIDTQGFGGKISVGKAKLSLFRRVAEIRKLDIELNKPLEKSSMDGILGVVYSDYDIEIKMVGLLSAPDVIFDSMPPLDREEIISLLIFGRTFEDLNQDNSRSVGAVSAALADRAMALASLYFFASTPIEGVSYDPQTGAVAAKLRLANGTSLTVGTRQGQTQQVGFRQNIGGNWSINTFLENDTEKGEQTGGGMIEYYKRY